MRLFDHSSNAKTNRCDEKVEQFCGAELERWGRREECRRAGCESSVSSTAFILTLIERTLGSFELAWYDGTVVLVSVSLWTLRRDPRRSRCRRAQPGRYLARTSLGLIS
jgi:hypothetical protein